MLNKYKQEWDDLSEKKNLSGKEALEAVKENGYALQYVINQTPEICLEAVKEDGNALRYVKEYMFSNKDIEIDGKYFSKETLKNALRAYVD